MTPIALYVDTRTYVNNSSGARSREREREREREVEVEVNLFISSQINTHKVNKTQ